MESSIRAFRETVWQRARELYRPMPWRDKPTFYHVLVSELMLQQTQVPRVRVKFAEFMQAFPDVEALAAAPLSDVLRIWQGLGYNRRAKFLHEAARYVVAHGQPTTREGLMRLPGVGHGTAGALMNYVYEVPTAFVETNVRTVYFNHFFEGRAGVSDRELLTLVDATMDREHPREWYWALMDYGTWLKRQGAAKLVYSKHYHRQSPLKGSVREVRGQIITRLTERDYTVDELADTLPADERFDAALTGLVRDGLVQCSGDRIHLTKH